MFAIWVCVSPLPIVRAGLLLAAAQLALVGLLGTSTAAVFTAGCGVAYLVAFSWADPLQLRSSDAVGATGLAAIATVPVATTTLSTWGLLCGASALGVALSRIQLRPRMVRTDRTGIDAHLDRVRQQGVDRSPGQAERARVGAQLDPLSGLLGNSSAPTPAVDPYEDTKTLSYEPDTQ